MAHPKDRTVKIMAEAPDYAHRVHGLLDLGGPWLGWKLRGTQLVSPDGDRITPERLRGILFRESLAPKKPRLQGDGAKQSLGVTVGAQPLHPQASALATARPSTPPLTPPAPGKRTQAA